MTLVDRVSTVGRGRLPKIWFTGLIAALVLPLGGCVPHPPEPAAPFSLSLADGGLEVNFCLGSASITRLAASVSQRNSTGWSEWSTISETTDNASIPVSFAESLPLQRQIPSVSYRVTPERSLPEGEFSITVYFSFEESGRYSYYNESFYLEFAAQLADGYLYSDGTFHSGACEMESARP